MIRKELALLKLGIICLQIVLMLLLLPSTQLITSQLLGGLVTNPLTLGILFLLHAYTYRNVVEVGCQKPVIYWEYLPSPFNLASPSTSSQLWS